MQPDKLLAFKQACSRKLSAFFVCKGHLSCELPGRSILRPDLFQKEQLEAISFLAIKQSCNQAKRRQSMG